MSDPTGDGDLYLHRGTRAIQRMVEYAPSTGGLALWVRHRDLGECDSPLLAANDGATVFYGPAFEYLPLAEQVGLVAHQVLHVALRHPQRFGALQRRLGDVDRRLFNVCADAIVNSALSHLSWLALPQSAVRLEDLLRGALGIDQPVEKSLLEWDLERLYRAVDDRRAADSGRRTGGRGKGGSDPENRRAKGGQLESQALDSDAVAPRRDGPRSAWVRVMGADTSEDLLPGADSGEPQGEAELSREWSQRLIRGHAGDGPHSMLRELLADLPRVRTPWEQALRAQLARGLSLKPGISWSRPSRSYLANRGRVGSNGRLPWEPGRTASRAVARLAVIVDCSGSVEDPLMDRFAREIEAITRRLESAVTVIVGDDRVRLVQTFNPGRSNLRDVVFEGGGGTDFSPLLREADRYRPDLGVVLTDLQGPAEYRPAWPVLWAVPREWEHAEVPFGRKLVLD